MVRSQPTRTTHACTKDCRGRLPNLQSGLQPSGHLDSSSNSSAIFPCPSSTTSPDNDEANQLPVKPAIMISVKSEPCGLHCTVVQNTISSANLLYAFVSKLWPYTRLLLSPGLGLEICCRCLVEFHQQPPRVLDRQATLTLQYPQHKIRRLFSQHIPCILIALESFLQTCHRQHRRP